MLIVFAKPSVSLPANLSVSLVSPVVDLGFDTPSAIVILDSEVTNRMFRESYNKIKWQVIIDQIEHRLNGPLILFQSYQSDFRDEIIHNYILLISPFKCMDNLRWP